MPVFKTKSLYSQDHGIEIDKLKDISRISITHSRMRSLCNNSRDDFEEIPNIVTPTIFDSSNALHSLDERLSVDVQITLPISNKIFSKDGGEEHEFIVARFPLNDYNKFETTLESTPEAVTDNVIVREDVNVGLEDLTRKSPSSSAIHLLPGTIQQINVQLQTRYYSDGKVVSSPTKMEHGFWTIKLLFGKKV